MSSTTATSARARAAQASILSIAQGYEELSHELRLAAIGGATLEQVESFQSGSSVLYELLDTLKPFLPGAPEKDTREEQDGARLRVAG